MLEVLQPPRATGWFIATVCRSRAPVKKHFLWEEKKKTTTFNLDNKAAEPSAARMPWKPE